MDEQLARGRNAMRISSNVKHRRELLLTLREFNAQHGFVPIVRGRY